MTGKGNEDFQEEKVVPEGEIAEGEAAEEAAEPDNKPFDPDDVSGIEALLAQEAGSTNEEGEPSDELEDEPEVPIEEVDVEVDVPEPEEEEQLGAKGFGFDDLVAWAEQEKIRPANLKKSWEKFTEAMQDLADERQQLQQVGAQIEQARQELAPAIQLMQYVEQDPEFEEYLNAYQPKGLNRSIGDDSRFSEMSQRQAQLEQQLMLEQIQRGIDALKSEYGDIDIDEDRLIQFMAENGIADPNNAFLALYGPELIKGAKTSAKESVTADIKNNGKKKTVKKPQNKGIEKSPITPQEAAKMGDEDFIANYDSLIGGLK